MPDDAKKLLLILGATVAIVWLVKKLGDKTAAVIDAATAKAS